MTRRIKVQKLKVNGKELVVGRSTNDAFESANMQESANTLNVKNKRRNYASCACCNDYRFTNFGKCNNLYIIWG
jgi:hypothetical protein